MIKDHQFIFIAEGMGKAKIQNRSYLAKKGDLFYYGPGISHFFIADNKEPFTLYGIHFAFNKTLPEKGGIFPVQTIGVNGFNKNEPINSLQLGSKGRDEFLIPEYCHIGLNITSDLLLEIAQNYPRENAVSPKLVQTLFTQFLLQLRNIVDRSLNGFSTTDDMIVQLKKQLELHVEQVYTRDWLRKWTQYHADHGARLFRKKFGVSPYEYHSEIKLQRAKQLLTNTELRINEISEKLYFGSVQHFSRKFKLKTGYSPTDYRNLSRMI
jgi:AraC-like DNA-binding protein